MVIVIVIAISGVLFAQRVLDQVIVRFGGEIVTQLDVRQARMLKLIPGTSDSDQALVDALVNRRLMLAELRRSGGPEPTAGALEARYREWQGRLGPGANVADRLEQGGMTDAGLRGWLRDDLRIEAYLAERFSGRQADVNNWVTVLRQRAGLK